MAPTAAQLPTATATAVPSGMPSLEEWADELWSAFDADPAVQVDERGWLESDVGTLPYLELTFQPIDSGLVEPVRLYQCAGHPG